MDMEVNEHIAIDEPFCMRNLIWSKREKYEYLLLVLSAENFRIFLSRPGRLVRILSSVPEHIQSFRNDLPQRVSNFSDPSAHKELMLDKFLRYADHTLGMILNAYPLPIFLMATERTSGHFKKNYHTC